MKVLLIGRSGQLATELQKQAPQTYELLVPDRSQLTLENGITCYDYVLKHEPDWVINAGAYTNVDLAETESRAAYQLNAHGPGAIALALKKTGGKLLHVSTDYVFHGDKSGAYEITDDPAPVNVYGASKFWGEHYISATLDSEQYALVRTSWVYSATGKNFVKTMLDVFRSQGGARVVVDQYGCPTSAVGLAETCWRIVDRSLTGVFHWTDGSAMSWADFADAIAEEAFNLKMLEQRPTIIRVDTSDYLTPAIRPKFSILNCLDSYERLEVERPHWLANLRGVLKELVVD
jgi:dTDP-4-dehydrorhamnose reductase